MMDRMADDDTFRNCPWCGIRVDTGECPTVIYRERPAVDRDGPSFVIMAAPIGVFVPVLPPFYTTVWVSGLPYYYANDTYYVWRDGEDGYEVVEPPNDQGASTQPPPGAAPPGEDLYIYPQNGQAADRQASDKYECHKWASTQTGFDPTQSTGGVPPEEAPLKRADYQRAMRACLEGRGYSVR